MTGHVRVSTSVPASCDVVWSRITTPEGVNDELRPLIRMTIPRGLNRVTMDDIKSGTDLGRSWLMLFGVVPFDYDDIHIAELTPGRGFFEDSEMFLLRPWQHRRTLNPEGHGCIVTDELTFRLRGVLGRIPGLLRFVEAIVRRLFRHRHRRLGLYFESVRGH
jgi:ligand-binding SRPBCC domain-containing protein